MGDRHSITSGGAVGMALLLDIKQGLFELRWCILFLAFLIIADLYFGIRESKQKRRIIRRSRALRRSLNKFMDYMFALCFVLVLNIIFIQHNINIPYFSLIAFALISIFELESVVNHWLVLHDRKRIHFKKLFKSILKHKRKDLSDIVEDYEKETNNNNK